MQVALYFFAVFFLGEFFFVIIKNFLSQILGFVIHGSSYIYNIWSILIEPLSKAVIYGISAGILALIIPSITERFTAKPKQKQLLTMLSIYLGIRTTMYLAPWFTYQFKHSIFPLITYSAFMLLSIPIIYIAYLLVTWTYKFYRHVEAHLLAAFVTHPLFLITAFVINTRYLGSFFSINSVMTTLILLVGAVLLYSILLLFHGIISKILRKLFTKKYFNSAASLTLITLLIVALINYSSYFVFDKFIRYKKGGGDKPDIFFVVLDALNYNFLSCNGFPSRITPNLDRISAKGYRYTNFYSSATWSRPSYTSIFSGIYPSYHRIQGGLARDEENALKSKTLTETLKENGYLTALFNDNPFIDKTVGTTRGFDFINHDWIDYQYTLSDTIFDIGIRDFLNNSFPRQARTQILEILRRGYPGIYKYIIQTVQKIAFYRTQNSFLFKKAKYFIEKNNNRGMPMFVCIVAMLPHHPYTPPALCVNEFLYGKFETNQDIADFYWSYCIYSKEPPKIYDRKRWEDIGRTIGPKPVVTRMLYAANVNYADYLVGDLYEYLKGKVDMKNCLFIVTSDHGEEVEYEIGKFNHYGILYNSVIKTPLIVTFPKRFDGGVTIAKKTQNVDFTPSILRLIEALGYDSVAYQGLNTLFDKDLQSEDRNRVIVVEFLDSTSCRQAIIDGDYKYMRFKEAGIMDYKLYNLKVDPNEQNNIIEGNKDIAMALDKKIDEWMNKYASKIMKIRPLDKKTSEIMKSLGYLQ